MKATFALLANLEVHNFIRKLSWDIHLKYRTGTRHASLPPHISIKQPFSVSDLPALEKYMDDLAMSIQPIEVRLTDLQAIPTYFDGVEYGVLMVGVEESKHLYELNNQINRDLNLQFWSNRRDHDRDIHHFHMTVMMCGQLMEICRKYETDIEHKKVNMRYIPRELAMFVYDEPMGPHGDYLCYKILPLGGH